MKMKSILKVTGAVCAATGVVALSGLVASGAAVGAVVEGFKSAKDTMKKMMSENVQAGDNTSKTEEPTAETSDSEEEKIFED